jgi:hypothetical protein
MPFEEGTKEPERSTVTDTDLNEIRKIREFTNLNEIRKTDWTFHLVWRICDCSNPHSVSEYSEKQKLEEATAKAEASS